MSRRKYFKKRGQAVIAVKLDLEFKHFEYRKWRGLQRAKRGDWLVDNDGDVYTIDARVFARTYKRVRPGVYRKEASVWAEVATAGGTIKTKEGASRYKRGDYIVYNNRNGSDGYCITPDKFRAMYRLHSIGRSQRLRSVRRSTGARESSLRQASRSRSVKARK